MSDYIFPNLDSMSKNIFTRNLFISKLRELIFENNPIFGLLTFGISFQDCYGNKTNPKYDWAIDMPEYRHPYYDDFFIDNSIHKMGPTFIDILNRLEMFTGYKTFENENILFHRNNTHNKNNPLGLPVFTHEDILNWIKSSTYPIPLSSALW